jgi:hypothetical protein
MNSERSNPVRVGGFFRAEAMGGAVQVSQTLPDDDAITGGICQKYPRQGRGKTPSGSGENPVRVGGKNPVRVGGK